MKLQKITIASFKRISRVELPLGAVNILVGANGAGKSSIIQAVHLACCLIRQVSRVDPSRTSTVSVDELDYLPSNDYKSLGHNLNWGNATGSPSSTVQLEFKNDGGEAFEAYCVIRSAKNAGISLYGRVPTEIAHLLRNQRKFFSAYTPGISGIPNREERKSRKVVLKACSFGDSNVILRNALLLLRQMHWSNIVLIQNMISRVIGPVVIEVQHDESSDLFIKCNITIEGVTKPLELAGTGYLQLIQIFCYIVLFEPGILLIDEPDTHLHPDVQEKLVKVLAEVADEKNIKILLTTHSPFIVRGAPLDCNVYWLDSGTVGLDNRSAVELALGWGAFGKKILIFSEDAKTLFLRKLISQWPDIEKYVAFQPGNGYKSLINPSQASELHSALGGKYKILIHRDRDSMTDDEVNDVRLKYEQEVGVFLWMPSDTDVEAYFCNEQFVANLTGVDAAEVRGIFDEIYQGQGAVISDQFAKQRAAHNAELYPMGGSPLNDDVWSLMLRKELKGAKGKLVFNQLKNKIPGGKFSPDSIMGFSMDGGLAPDLRSKLEELLRD